MKDAQIVALYLSRSEDAIKCTAEKYGTRLQSLSFGIVQDAQTAEECENDTYLEAWYRIPPHEPADYFYAFLARITRNLSLNRCRERSRLKRQGHICRLTSELEQCLPAPDNAAGRMDDLAFSQVINGFLAALPSEKRIIFLRRYWYLDSVAGIAMRCGLSRSKVKTTLYRCREQLRSYLEKEGYPL